MDEPTTGRGRARGRRDDGQLEAATLDDEPERDPGAQHEDKQGRERRPRDGSLASWPRRLGIGKRATEVAGAVGVRGLEADELLLARGLGLRDADRGAHVLLVRAAERHEQDAVDLAPEERADVGVRRAGRVVEHRKRGSHRHGLGAGTRRRAAVHADGAIGRHRRIVAQLPSLPVRRCRALRLTPGV